MKTQRSWQAPANRQTTNKAQAPPMASQPQARRYYIAGRLKSRQASEPKKN